MARKAISTFVTALPMPVAPAFAAASGASVGAGSGKYRTAAASIAATIAERSAATARKTTLGRSANADISLVRSRDDARRSNAPVKPLPIAPSINATSMASSRTQASVSNNP